MENDDHVDYLRKIIISISNNHSSVYELSDLSGIAEFQELKKKPKEALKESILNLVYLEFTIRNFSKSIIANLIHKGIMLKKLDYTEEEWMKLFNSYISYKDEKSFLENFFELPLNSAVKQIEHHLKKNELSEQLKAFVVDVLQWDVFDPTKIPQHNIPISKRIKKKLESLIVGESEIQLFNLDTKDIGEDVNDIFKKISDHKENISKILKISTTAKGARPNNKFKKETDRLIDEVGLDVYRKIAHQILELPIKLGITQEEEVYTYQGREQRYITESFLQESSQKFIKGIVWTMDRFSDKESIRILSKLCEKAYTKLPGKGPYAASVGNTCVYTLGNMRGKDALGALSRLKLKLRQNNIKKLIDNQLIAGAKKYNVSVEELKEMSVPDFALVNGRKTIEFDDYKLSIEIEGKKVVQKWNNSEGKAMKSVPALVKKSVTLTKKLSDIRKEVKEIQKVFSAQKQRIDNQFILGREWGMSDFKKFYIDHGLVSLIAKKIIWAFSNGSKQEDCIYLEGNWYTVDNEKIDWIDDDTKIKLWHPINSDEKAIVAWRDKMMELEWQQPIKQAYREIYILTDAEITTKSYSNRMASHILKQHQFNTLAVLRNWKYSLLGWYDDGRDTEICQKKLPEYGMVAEFWIDELGQDNAYNDAGIWFHISTDQVKFKKEGGETIDLIDVPKIVFTEIMRDVDMFVGVCSVGNDPQWMDNNGDRQINRDYWKSYSFGDLREIAKTRKTILENLLPRLKKIRDKATIEGNFLKIRGQIRNYKIHIGSGNILMEPNDLYLCIVPARATEKSIEKLFIPFEGDRGLSIVLSKAFLLVEDDTIVDSTIVSQIGKKR